MTDVTGVASDFAYNCDDSSDSPLRQDLNSSKNSAKFRQHSSYSVRDIVWPKKATEPFLSGVSIDAESFSFS